MRDDPNPPGTVLSLNLKKLFGPADENLGYPDFDPLFDVKAFALPRARAYFTPPTTRRLVRAIAHSAVSFQMNDREVAIVNRGFTLPDALAMDIDRLVALVDALTPGTSTGTGAPYRG